MRGNMMQWVGRLVAAVFLVGVVALTGAVVVLVRQAEGIPPWPVFMGVVGMVALILLAGACLALISIAGSAQRSAEALRRMAIRGAELRPVGPAVPEAAADPIGPFTPKNLQEVPKKADPAPTRPARPAGRSLVAER
ncbi:hypothetical protein [Paracoccus sp. JM45]|uniref:hypothetical protein n=1 Tax=Paracoccus sp. JM45 TaxID=2283626 RepID=UPI000E6CB59B|nr:hypothetical protein [Paracoccus sp. JM45]RJE80753.1 hypothetical protein DWB67_03830 [Paracoccus sp. JM45]